MTGITLEVEILVENGISFARARVLVLRNADTVEVS
jgi:hypothetical protein